MGALVATNEKDDSVLILGGLGRDAQPLADTWSWAENSWVGQQSSNPPNVGMRGAMAYDSARQEVVLLTDAGAKDFGPSQTWIGR
jgi:hypothetical protein